MTGSNVAGESTSTSSAYKSCKSGNIEKLLVEEEGSQTTRLKVINDLLIGSVLGCGSFAKVKECWNVKSGERYALKIYALANARNKMFMNPQGVESLFQRLKRSFFAVSRVKAHINLCTLHSVAWDAVRQKLYATLEMCDGCTLADFVARLHANGLLQLSVLQNHIRTLFFQLALAIDHLHAHSVAHLDVKPENIMLTPTGLLKLVDFDLAQKWDVFSEEMTTAPVFTTPVVQAPETIAIAADAIDEDEADSLCENATKKPPSLLNAEKLDVWAFGVCLYFATTGTYPFFSDDGGIFALYRQISQQAPDLSEVEHDSSLCDLILQCLDKNPANRPTIGEIRRHEWFANVTVTISQKIDALGHFLVQFMGSDFLPPNEAGRVSYDAPFVTRFIAGNCSVAYRRLPKINT